MTGKTRTREDSTRSRGSKIPIVTIDSAPSAPTHVKAEAAGGGGGRRPKRRGGGGSKSENTEVVMEPRATRSSGSRIPVGVKSGGERRRQEPKHSLGGTNKENYEAKIEVKKMERHNGDLETDEIKKEGLELKSGNYLGTNKEMNRRPLSAIDQNRTDSVTSTTDLSDSVFADARSRLSSLADSCVKHRRSLSRSGQKVSSSSRSPPPPPVASPSSSSAPHQISAEEQPFTLPDGVVGIDDECEGWIGEYGFDMFFYLREREEHLVVDEDYLAQSSVSPEMRAVLVDWLLQVQHYLKLSQETLYLAISLLDTILDKRDIEADKLQLVGIASLYVASKCEEYYPADLKKLVHLTENSYEVQDVFDMELVLLGVVHFQVYVPTPADFLPRICRAALRPSKEFLETCSYLVDSHLYNSTHQSIAPSLLSSAAVLSSLLLYHIAANPEEDRNVAATAVDLDELWTTSLQFYTMYSITQVVPISKRLFVGLSHPKYTGARSKYKSRSQHSRLADLPHLSPVVVKFAHLTCSKACRLDT